MVMSRRRRLSLVLLACAASLLGARAAHACSCLRAATVLDAYERAEVVVVVRVVSLEKAEPEKNGRPDPVVSAKAAVEKVYKGDLKAGDEMTFAQGGGGGCDWGFDDRSVGRKFLFYVSRPKDSALWSASICGRSNVVEGAGDDLLYLDKLDKVRGRSRISGTIRAAHKDAPNGAGRKVRIVGAGRTHEVTTNEEGVYEIYDLPAGNYYVDVETPPGWKIGSHYSDIRDLKEPRSGSPAPKGPAGIPVVLEEKKHSGLDLRFEIDNAVRGKVFDPSGRPMKDVCLKLLPADGRAPKYSYTDGCTDEGGAFEIDEIPPGGYFLAVNPDGRLSSAEPFGTFYYPNVFKREEATVLKIGRGDFVENVNIQVPKIEETVTVEGVLLYSDGKPIVAEWVEFKPERTGGGGESGTSAPTDSAGRFSLIVLKGRRGELFAKRSFYASEVENCPELESIIKQSGQTIVDVRTQVVEIPAEENLRGVELRYPFPECRKAK